MLGLKNPMLTGYKISIFSQSLGSDTTDRSGPDWTGLDWTGPLFVTLEAWVKAGFVESRRGQGHLSVKKEKSTWKQEKFQKEKFGAKKFAVPGVKAGSRRGQWANFLASKIFLELFLLRWGQGRDQGRVKVIFLAHPNPNSFLP